MKKYNEIRNGLIFYALLSALLILGKLFNLVLLSWFWVIIIIIAIPLFLITLLWFMLIL